MQVLNIESRDAIPRQENEKGEAEQMEKKYNVYLFPV